MHVRSGLWPCGLHTHSTHTPSRRSCTSQGGSARPRAVRAACAMRPLANGAPLLSANWSVFLLPFSVWCRHRSRLAFRHAARVRASHQAPAPVPALTSPLRCSPPASRSLPSSREPWSPCAGHVASIPAEQLDCRGCSAARFAPPRNVQVPLPEGIPRGVEDLPAARARRRQCRQPLDHAVRPAALGRPFHVHRLFPAARRAGTRRTCSSSTRATSTSRSCYVHTRTYTNTAARGPARTVEDGWEAF